MKYLQTKKQQFLAVLLLTVLLLFTSYCHSIFFANYDKNKERWEPEDKAHYIIRGVLTTAWVALAIASVIMGFRSLDHTKSVSLGEPLRLTSMLPNSFSPKQILDFHLDLDDEGQLTIVISKDKSLDV